ncbi:SH3 domain-containing protein [Sphingomonas sp. HMP6]|uniref:SH3 domain-containing protein n=1 Tax=Sphingomonas sp. HMP6 TaxID=1517551 RepID=UPI001596942A|nr:SH3 domain-containing protein [Sphingomonas sp. HMP6]BCA58184.1 hypothetical protein HMP06_0953 [Sphingomonas sp. HMP6]
MRRDLADIRLADQVFAPHYAASVPRIVVAATPLRQGTDLQSGDLAELAVGDVFEVLEFVKGRAWGRSPAHNLVGYVDADALSWPSA